MLYKAVDLTQKSADGELVQYVGVYVLRWGHDKEPTIGFREATKGEVQAEAKRMEQWKQLGDALRLLWAYLPESTADSMLAEDLAQIDAALEASKEE